MTDAAAEESMKALERIREFMRGAPEVAIGAWFCDKNALRLARESALHLRATIATLDAVTRERDEARVQLHGAESSLAAEFDRAEDLKAERDEARVQARMNLINDAQRDREAELTRERDALKAELDIMFRVRDSMMEEASALKAQVAEVESYRAANQARAERAEADAARLRAALKKSVNLTCTCANDPEFRALGHAGWCDARAALAATAEPMMEQHAGPMERGLALRDAALAATEPEETEPRPFGLAVAPTERVVAVRAAVESREAYGLRVAEAVREACAREVSHGTDTSVRYATTVRSVNLAAIVRGVR